MESNKETEAEEAQEKESPVSVYYLQNELFPELPSEDVMTSWVRAAAERPVNITIRFVDKEEGYELNSRYRHKDYATNVLTFDYQHEPVVEADIVICVPVLVGKRAAENLPAASLPPDCSRHTARAWL